MKANITLYPDILEFDCSEYKPEWGWVSLIKNDIRIMLSIPNSHFLFKELNFTGSFNITIDDLDLDYAGIKGKVKLELLLLS